MTALIDAIEVELATVTQRQADLHAELEQLENCVERLRAMRELADGLDDVAPATPAPELETVTSRKSPAKVPHRELNRPAAPQRTQRKRATLEEAKSKVLELAARNATVTESSCVEAGIASKATVHRAILALHSAGKLNHTKTFRRQKHYALAGAGAQAKPTVTGASKPKAPDRQQPTLTGRVAGLIRHRQLSPTAIADELGEPVSDVMASLKQLEAEGEASHHRGIWMGEP